MTNIAGNEYYQEEYIIPIKLETKNGASIIELETFDDDINNNL